MSKPMLMILDDPFGVEVSVHYEGLAADFFQQADLRSTPAGFVKLRLATAADIPADLAAEALGLSAEDLYGGNNYEGGRTARLRASNLVREAETGGTR